MKPTYYNQAQQHWIINRCRFMKKQFKINESISDQIVSINFYWNMPYYVSKDRNNASIIFWPNYLWLKHKIDYSL